MDVMAVRVLVGSPCSGGLYVTKEVQRAATITVLATAEADAVVCAVADASVSISKLTMALPIDRTIATMVASATTLNLSSMRVVFLFMLCSCAVVGSSMTRINVDPM